jgi:hypothetical protein
MSDTTIPKPDFMEEEAWNALVAARDHSSIMAASKNHVQQHPETGAAGETFTTQGGPTLRVCAL